MRELKILAVVAFFTAVVYWGVEPFAHSQMHPHVAPADYDFARGDIAYDKEVAEKAQKAYAQSHDELKKLESAKSDSRKIDAMKKVVAAQQKEASTTQEKLAQTTAFWKELEPLHSLKGDASKGAETFINAGCTGCHSLNVAGIPAPMDDASASASFGVVPPDLSTAGAIYDRHYLAALIKNPAKALKVEHKFDETRLHPMIAFSGLGGDLNQELADIVAYLQSIAPKEISDKQVDADACQRCHDMKYDKLLSQSDKTALSAYMGTLPPDLSIMIRAKSDEYLHTFINNPQKQLAGTSMPRVGLTQKAEAQVVAYMEKTGDRKKAEREDLGYKLIGFMVIFTILAYLWKVKIWREVH